VKSALDEYLMLDLIIAAFLFELHFRCIGFIAVSKKELWLKIFLRVGIRLDVTDEAKKQTVKTPSKRYLAILKQDVDFWRIILILTRNCLLAGIWMAKRL